MNMGIIDRLISRIERNETKIRKLSVQSLRSESTGGVESVTGIPSTGSAGSLIYITNGRKSGEGIGAGTGIVAYHDGSNWYRFADDTVAAV